MLQDLARTLHVSPAVFDLLGVAGLLIAAFVAGFALNRIFHRYAQKLHKTWGELIFSLLESLPIPQLLLVALYNALETFRLPRQWYKTTRHADVRISMQPRTSFRSPSANNRCARELLPRMPSARDSCVLPSRDHLQGAGFLQDRFPWFGYRHVTWAEGRELETRKLETRKQTGYGGTEDFR